MTPLNKLVMNMNIVYLLIDLNLILKITDKGGLCGHFSKPTKRTRHCSFFCAPSTRFRTFRFCAYYQMDIGNKEVGVILHSIVLDKACMAAFGSHSHLKGKD